MSEPPEHQRMRSRIATRQPARDEADGTQVEEEFERANGGGAGGRRARLSRGGAEGRRRRSLSNQQERGKDCEEPSEAERP